MNGPTTHTDKTAFAVAIIPAAQQDLVKTEGLGTMIEALDNGNLRVLEAARPRPQTSMVNKVYESRSTAKPFGAGSTRYHNIMHEHVGTEPSMAKSNFKSD
jgi:hypothetical protein